MKPIYSGDCWKNSYQRGVGLIPDACPLGYEKEGLNCKELCNLNYVGKGAECRNVCPPEFKEDGRYCKKPETKHRKGG